MNSWDLSSRSEGSKGPAQGDWQAAAVGVCLDEAGEEETQEMEEEMNPPDRRDHRRAISPCKHSAFIE